MKRCPVCFNLFARPFIVTPFLAVAVQCEVEREADT